MFVPEPPGSLTRSPYTRAGLYVRLASTRQFVALSLALSASVAGFVAAGLRPVRAALPLLREGHLHFSHLMQVRRVFELEEGVGGREG